MKRHISVFYLIARESIYKLLAVMAISVALQLLLFNISCSNGLQFVRVDSIFDGSKIQYVFFATIIALAVLLCKTGMQFSSQSGYTLRRLRIPEKAVFALQSIYNFTVLFFIVCTEIVLCFLLAEKGIAHLPDEYVTNQSIYIAFYSNEFLQNMFCGQDALRIVRNICTGFALSVNYAAFSFLSRYGRRWLAVIPVTAVLIIYAEQLNAGVFDLIMSGLMLASAFAAVIKVMRRDKYAL